MTFAFVFESVGGGEWLMLLAVILVVVGPKNLPSMARKIGNVMSTLRRAADEFKRQLMSMDEEMKKTVNDIKSDCIDIPPDGTDTSGNEQSMPGDDGYSADGSENPYGDTENPYPGHSDFYDETQYSDTGPEMGTGSPEGVDGEVPVTGDETPADSAVAAEPDGTTPAAEMPNTEPKA